jgi:hypothetical protein
VECESREQGDMGGVEPVLGGDLGMHGVYEEDYDRISLKKNMDNGSRFLEGGSRVMENILDPFALFRAPSGVSEQQITESGDYEDPNFYEGKQWDSNQKFMDNNLTNMNLGHKLDSLQPTWTDRDHENEKFDDINEVFPNNGQILIAEQQNFE